MKKIHYFLAGLLFFFITSITNYQELDDLALLSSIGFDYKDNQYTLILKEVTSRNYDEETIYKYNYHRTSCKKLNDCFHDIKNTTTDKLYYNTIDTIVISKDIYDDIIKGIEEVHELKRTLSDESLVFVSDEDVLELFEVNKDYGHINSLVNNNQNSLLKIRKNMVEKETYKVPSLKIENDEVILAKSVKVRNLYEK